MLRTTPSIEFKNKQNIEHKEHSDSQINSTICWTPRTYKMLNTMFKQTDEKGGTDSQTLSSNRMLNTLSKQTDEKGGTDCQT